jgi:hypothetical protein
VLPTEPPLSLLSRPDGYHRVPTMLGTNRDEQKTFMLLDPKHVRRITPLYMRLRDPDTWLAHCPG